MQLQSPLQEFDFSYYYLILIIFFQAFNELLFKNIQ